MNCPTCQDKGIVTVNWADAPHEYAVCLCQQGREMRATTNFRKPVAALWQVWAAQQQVDPARVWMLEDVLFGAELSERGFTVEPIQASGQSREAALLAASKSHRAKL